MSTFEIQDKGSIGAVDAAADLLLISDASAAHALKSTTRNNYLNLASAPVGLTDTQELTNKTLTQPVVVVDDDEFTLQDNSDTTKKLQFQLSGITTATTRTLTVPNVSDTLVTLGASQTLTGKTLTSPTINDATIANPTLTINTISEYSAANGVTIDGLNIKDSALVTNNSVPNNTLSNTGSFGSGWVWTSYVPTLGNLSGGTLNYARYTQIGKTVFVRFKYTLAGAGVTGAVTMSLPVTAASSYTADASELLLGTVVFLDVGTTSNPGIIKLTTTTTIALRPQNSSTTYLTAVDASSTVPFIFGSGDSITAAFCYEVA